MVTSAPEVPVVGRSFLVAVCRTDAAVHIEDKHLRRATVMHTIDPLPEKIGKRGEVLLRGQNLRLEAPHLTGRGSMFRDSMAADDPPHDRVEAEPVGIVHVVVPAKASENGLAELPDKTVATVLPSTGVREHVPGYLGQSDRIIQFSVRQQSSVGRDLGTLGNPALADGQNPASEPRLSNHPSGEPCQHPNSGNRGKSPGDFSF